MNFYSSFDENRLACKPSAKSLTAELLSVPKQLKFPTLSDGGMCEKLPSLNSTLSDRNNPADIRSDGAIGSKSLQSYLGAVCDFRTWDGNTLRPTSKISVIFNGNQKSPFRFRAGG